MPNKISAENLTSEATRTGSGPPYDHETPANNRDKYPRGERVKSKSPKVSIQYADLSLVWKNRKGENRTLAIVLSRTGVPLRIG